MDQNPYRSPLASDGPPPLAAAPGVRPASLTVFGILNMLFGILGICGSAASAAPFFVDLPRDPAVPNPMLDLMETDAAYRLFLQASAALGATAGIAVLAGGIGLLLSKAWGRTLSIVYAWYTIIAILVGMVVNWFVMQPLLAKMQAGDGPGRFVVIFGLVGGLIGGLVAMVYPIILLVFMNRKVLRDAVGASSDR